MLYSNRLCLSAAMSDEQPALVQVCQEAARAAWPAIAGAPGKAGPPELQRTDSARGEPAFQSMRLSAKLGDAGPQQLAGASLREGMQRMLGGEGSTPGLQASVRPGCTHLVVDALTFWVRPNTLLPGPQTGLHACRPGVNPS